MRYRINYSPEFLNDLFEIGDYIESQYQNPHAADRITEGIVDATDILAEYPETGGRIFLPGGLDSGYRFVIFQGYLAVYRIQPGEVFVARAVHEKQDYMRILFPRSQKEQSDS
jgi:plasmid stabilization system protein ParE